MGQIFFLSGDKWNIVWHFQQTKKKLKKRKKSCVNFFFVFFQHFFVYFVCVSSCTKLNILAENGGARTAPMICHIIRHLEKFLKKIIFALIKWRISIFEIRKILQICDKTNNQNVLKIFIFFPNIEIFTKIQNFIFDKIIGILFFDKIIGIWFMTTKKADCLFFDKN